eukprot:363200-Chlamydomonas_euryale.AAC.3
MPRVDAHFTQIAAACRPESVAAPHPPRRRKSPPEAAGPTTRRRDRQFGHHQWCLCPLCRRLEYQPVVRPHLRRCSHQAPG